MAINEITALEQIGFPILSTLIVLPLCWCLLMLMYSGNRLRELALAGALVQAALAIFLLLKFKSGTADFQFTETLPWMPAIGASYHLGVDGISILFIPMTAIVHVLLVLACWSSVKYYKKQYLIALFVISSTTIGIFTSLDLILYFLFWELALIPVFFLIQFWGVGQGRQHVGQKYVVYMLASSAPLLIGFLLLGLNHLDVADAMGQTDVKVFDLLALMNVEVPTSLQTIILVCLIIGFAVKAPIVPFHTWLSSSLMEGPLGTAAFLVGFKLGIYGILRFVIPLVPDALVQWGWVLAVLGIIAVIYGGLIALVQANLRRLIAFASISHVGLALVGIASFNMNGIQGVIIALFHLGIIATTLLLMAEFIYIRYGSTDIKSLGGLAQQMPRLSAVFFIFGMAFIAVPGTSGFTSEFLILLGAFDANWIYAILGLAGVILSACYFLNYFRKAFLGEIKTQYTSSYDLERREWLIITPALVVIFWLGLFPAPFLDITSSSVEHILQSVERGQ
jgi:NADH-quinone oxidoreductase subunit M